jgi:hypothetical protein
LGFITLPEDPDFIEARLDHAQRRLEESTPYSPDWDAASEAVEDLKQRLLRAVAKRAARISAA